MTKVMNKYAEELDREPQEKVAEGLRPEAILNQSCEAVVNSPEVDEEDDIDATAEAIDYVKKIIARQRAKAGESMKTTPYDPTQNDPASLPKTIDETPASTSTTQQPPQSPVMPLASQHLALDSLAVTSSVKERQKRQNIQPKDIERMREAANISTKVVLDSHEMQSIYQSILVYLILAVVSIIVSLMLVGLTNGFREVGYTAAIVVTGVATYATWRFIRLTSRLVKIVNPPSREKGAG